MVVELSWSVDPGAGGVARLGGGAYDPFQSNAAGYGAMRRGICDGLAALGVQYTIHPAPHFLSRIVPADYRDGMPEEWRHRPHPGGTRWRRFCRSTDIVDAPPPPPITRPGVTRICIGTPDSWTWDGAEYRIGFTMWESSEIPIRRNSWVPWLEAADVVLVPCEHNAALVRRHTRAAVEVVPLGLDGSAWPLMDRERRAGQPFVFLYAGQISYRKGWMQAYDAFKRAFGDSPAARLVIKTSGRSELGAMAGYRDPVVTMTGGKAEIGRRDAAARRSLWRYTFDDLNVLVLRSFWSRAAMLRLFARADAFLWPTLGEGWGLPPREAAATGLPVITCQHTGQYDADRWAWRVARSSPGGMAAVFGAWGYCGQWQKVDVDDLATAMVAVVDGHVEAAAWTRDVARPYVTARSWTDVAADVLAAADRLAADHETLEVKCA